MKPIDYLQFNNNIYILPFSFSLVVVYPCDYRIGIDTGSSHQQSYQNQIHIAGYSVQ